MSESEPTCKLCGVRAQPQNSHILPEFVYVPIHDEKHRGVRLDPFTLGAENSRKFWIQRGLRERMLCLDCEQFLNVAYEKPFKELWFDRRILQPLETRDHEFLR